MGGGAPPSTVCKGSIHYITYHSSEQPRQRGRGRVTHAFLQTGKRRPEEEKLFFQGHMLSDSRVRTRPQVFPDGSPSSEHLPGTGVISCNLHINPRGRCTTIFYGF